uniref:HEPN like, Abia C-terminal domain n=1 Tax=Siphoviridae sp. ctqzz19 TaxID=2825682 RepID=A0A8S5U2F6_9CAUD|nr:MAG TPA: HEPN like, Abia C-terminal domain [Siphoviridae sp. ctqzz19]
MKLTYKKGYYFDRTTAIMAFEGGQPYATDL